MRPALDLAKYKFKKDRGDFSLYGAWYGQHATPCLVLLPKTFSRRPVPLIIRLADAWKWNPDDPDARAASNGQLAVKFLQVNGFKVDTFTMMHVASFVHDNLGELLSMPPLPYGDEVVVAEFIKRDTETGKETHIEVKERV